MPKYKTQGPYISPQLGSCRPNLDFKDWCHWRDLPSTLVVANFTFNSSGDSSTSKSYAHQNIYPIRYFSQNMKNYIREYWVCTKLWFPIPFVCILPFSSRTIATCAPFSTTVTMTWQIPLITVIYICSRRVSTLRRNSWLVVIVPCQITWLLYQMWCTSESKYNSEGLRIQFRRMASKEFNRELKIKENRKIDK